MTHSANMVAFVAEPFVAKGFKTLFCFMELPLSCTVKRLKLPQTRHCERFKCGQVLYC